MRGCANLEEPEGLLKDGGEYGQARTPHVGIFLWHQRELCSLGFSSILKTVTLWLCSHPGQAASPPGATQGSVTHPEELGRQGRCRNTSPAGCKLSAEIGFIEASVFGPTTLQAFRLIPPPCSRLAFGQLLPPAWGLLYPQPPCVESLPCLFR